MTQRDTAWDGEPEVGDPDPSALSENQTETETVADGASQPDAPKHTHTDGKAEKLPAARRGGTKKATKRSDSAAIIKLPVREQRVESAEEDGDEAIEALTAQGFTTDEVLRLIRVSGRLANSREARESEATLRRLRFTRWLIEHGVLDEFSA